jgi:hypothetical protein
VTFITVWILRIIDLAVLLAGVWAFFDCLRSRPEVYPAIGRGTKPLWLLLLGGSVVVAVLPLDPLGLLGIAAIVAVSVYHLDVRVRSRI